MKLITQLAEIVVITLLITFIAVFFIDRLAQPRRGAAGRPLITAIVVCDAGKCGTIEASQHDRCTGTLDQVLDCLSK